MILYPQEDNLLIKEAGFVGNYNPGVSLKQYIGEFRESLE